MWICFEVGGIGSKDCGAKKAREVSETARSQGGYVLLAVTGFPVGDMGG